MIKIVSAFVALGVNPQAKSSSWLARRLKNHLQRVLKPAASTGYRVNAEVDSTPVHRAGRRDDRVLLETLE